MKRQLILMGRRPGKSTIVSETLKAWREDPVKFYKDVFGEEIQTWQAEAMRNISKEGRVIK